MGSEPQTATSIREYDTLRGRLADWLLLSGDRSTVAGCLVLVIAAVVWTFITLDLLAVGPDSSVSSLFGSGFSSGLFTLLTIALSINQLVLSRVFGTVDELSDRLDGSRELRENVASLAGVPSSPNDPAAFLSLVATTLTARANGLVAMVEETDWDPPSKVTNAFRDIAAYGESLDEHIEEESSINTVLTVVLGNEYAVNTTAVRHLENEFEGSIPEEASAEFQAVEELLESVAVVRQFYKTIAIHQDFATLSRLLVYTGVTALLTAITVTLIYRTNSVTVPAQMLPIVISAAIGIIFAPLALFMSYVLRAATVGRHTVSVGPFVPPKDR